MATGSMLLRSLIRRQGGDVASSSSSSSLFARTRSLASKPGTTWATSASSTESVKNPFDEKFKSSLFPSFDEVENSPDSRLDEEWERRLDEEFDRLIARADIRAEKDKLRAAEDWHDNFLKFGRSWIVPDCLGTVGSQGTLDIGSVKGRIIV